MNIIPRPQEYKINDGFFDASKLSYRKSEFIEAINLLKGDLSINENDNGNIIFIKENGLKEEEYFLEVNEKEVIIKASTPKGAFYAATSLLQLIQNNKIECINIHDYPKYSVRTFMIDSARHFFKKDIILRKIDQMSRLKYNEIHLHLSDDQGFRLDLKKYPKLKEISSKRVGSRIEGMVPWKFKFDDIPVSGYYTESDIKEICEFAKERMMRVIPELDCPGHFRAILSAYSEYLCFPKELEVWNNFGVSPEVLCLGNDKTIDFVYDLFKEIVKLFNCDTVHIGGDECPSTNYKVCPKCQEKMKKLGIKDYKEYQGVFTTELSNRLIKDGLNVRIWDEGVSKTMDKSITINYWTRKNNKVMFDMIKKGNKMIATPFLIYYADYNFDFFSLKDVYTYDLSFSKYISEKDRHNVIGVECPLWTEWVRSEDKMDFMFYPRAQAVVEAGWGTNSDFNDFINRLDVNNNYLEKIGAHPSPKEYYLRNLKGKGYVAFLYSCLKAHKFPTDVDYIKYRGKEDEQE